MMRSRAASPESVMRPHPIASTRARASLASFVLAPLAASLLVACGGDSNGGDKDTSDTTACTPGEKDCACTSSGTCDDGLVCEANVCVTEVVTPTCDTANCLELTLSGGDARACDVLVTTTGRKVAEVVYPEGSRGAMRTRDLRTAVSVIATSDAALTGVVAKVVFEGDAAVADTEASVARATCYDKTGAAATGVTATLR